LIYSNDFNSDRRVLEFATEHNAKIFLSLGLDQILKAPFIEFFETACVNIHPAKLPDFRGPDPIFQFLLTAELTLGVTLHRIASEIDQGDIMLIDSIQRTADDTHLSLLRQYVEIGCLLFLRFLEKSQCAGIPQNNLPIRFPYKSWPTRCDIERFAANRYFLLGDLARALRIV
jgi:methionyl-tRNA formyltransferase